MKLLFLDIDGVLNDHIRHDNGYCGIQAAPVAQLNRILDAVPDLQIVISSAWRYCVHNGDITLKGFESLLLIHGVKCRDRLHGVTERDAEAFKAEDHKAQFDPEYWKVRRLAWRKSQIFEYWAKCLDMPGSIVLDDLPLDLANLVQTDPVIGLTAELADEVIRRLS